MKTSMVAAIAVLSIGTAWAAEQTLSGKISDVMCGASHEGMPKKMTDRECTQDCASKGAQYVLVSGDKTYKLTNHASDLKAHAGERVTITGDVQGDTVRVSKVQAAN